MKFSFALLLAPTALAFAPSASFVRKSSLFIGKDPNVQLGGNPWKPDSDKMGVGVRWNEFLPISSWSENGILFSHTLLFSLQILLTIFQKTTILTKLNSPVEFWAHRPWEEEGQVFNFLVWRIWEPMLLWWEVLISILKFLLVWNSFLPVCRMAL